MNTGSTSAAANIQVQRVMPWSAETPKLERASIEVRAFVGSFLVGGTEDHPIAQAQAKRPKA